MLKKLCCLVLFVSVAPIFAQNSAPANPPAQGTAPRRGNFTPCWQQAGIEKSVMEQRWSIERETRSQVEAVCSNSSLTPQQKHEQAREIRRQAHQKMEGLITPDQEKALTACQQQHGEGHPGGGRMHEEGGGCGEWPRGGQRQPNGNSGSAPPPGNSSQQN